MSPHCLQSAHFKKGLSLIEAECAVTTIAVVHALSLGLKFKEKVNLNERYPVGHICIRININVVFFYKKTNKI